MAAGSQGDDDDIISAINVTPLVDIVLVLLIIMMVTASYIVSKSIPMDLPEGVTGQEPPPRTLSISMDREGTLYVDAEEVTWEQLRSRARRFSDEETEPRATLAIDRNVSHGEFIHIVDILRAEGVARYAINVNPQDTTQNE